MIYCAAVRGSFVGMRGFLMALYQEGPLSRWEEAREGRPNGGMVCERAGEMWLGEPCTFCTITNTFSSIGDVPWPLG
jgi:hypothetical protein